MSAFYTSLTLLIVISAVFSYINHRYIKLPNTIGVMLISLACSVLLIAVGPTFPELSRHAVAVVRRVDFGELVMKVLLSFLLFAGAIQIDLKKLRKHKAAVFMLATASVAISTFIIGVGMYYIFPIFHVKIGLPYCLMFGALISPTDPIAVLSILKKAGIPESMEIKITGESLFNDGVAIVLFLIFYHWGDRSTPDPGLQMVLGLITKEAGGGIVIGLLLGYVGFLLIRSIDNYKVETFITLAMSELSRDYVYKFWELVDEILNAVLFLLIGFEMLVIVIDKPLIWTGLMAIPVILLARWASVALPIFLLSFRYSFEKYSILILTWGGMRGAVSVALALSIPVEMYREEIVTVTYVAVIFSIIVQGITIGGLAKKLNVGK